MFQNVEEKNPRILLRLVRQKIYYICYLGHLFRDKSTTDFHLLSSHIYTEMVDEPLVLQKVKQMSRAAANIQKGSILLPRHKWSECLFIVSFVSLVPLLIRKFG